MVICGNVIMAAHGATICAIIAVIFVVVPSSSLLLWRPGLTLVLLCVAWMALVAAIVSARDRDIPLMIKNILKPVLAHAANVIPEQLHRQSFLSDYNPFTHMIALVREPLLDGTPSLTNGLVVLGSTVFGWAGTVLFFARIRARIVYWL